MENLKELVRIANDAVVGIDEPLKSKAFEKILDKLLGNAKQGKKKSSRKSQSRTRASTKAKASSKQDDILKKLASALNRSKYPKIYDFKKTLDRALYVLLIARNEHNTDGLTSPQISQLLTNVFRLKTSNAAVSMALMDAKLMVDREAKSATAGGRTFIYRIMKAGEDHLQKCLKEDPDKK